MDAELKIEVAYATPEKQKILLILAPAGLTLSEAIERSGIREEFPDMVVDPERVGIFGRKAKMEQVLRDGDRVEIYRPLIADPKESRRRRAEEYRQH
jgi:putative ubiquitin-RnfH superfamily antitoxin RatB of RatAB toxin-antitoxin module